MSREANPRERKRQKTEAAPSTSEAASAPAAVTPDKSSSKKRTAAVVSPSRKKRRVTGGSAEAPPTVTPPRADKTEAAAPTEKKSSKRETSAVGPVASAPVPSMITRSKAKNTAAVSTVTTASPIVTAFPTPAAATPKGRPKLTKAQKRALGVKPRKKDVKAWVVLVSCMVAILLVWLWIFLSHSRYVTKSKGTTLSLAPALQPVTKEEPPPAKAPAVKPKKQKLAPEDKAGSDSMMWASAVMN